MPKELNHEVADIVAVEFGDLLVKLNDQGLCIDCVLGTIFTSIIATIALNNGGIAASDLQYVQSRASAIEGMNAITQEHLGAVKH